MLSTDGEEFEAQIRVLFANWDKPPSKERIEAYRRGLQSMQMPALTRLIDYAISPDGPDDLPTPKGMWALQREMREHQRLREQALRPQQAAAGDDHALLVNRWLLVFLLAVQGVEPDVLPRLQRTKDTILEGFRQEPVENSLAWLELAMDAFLRAWGQPATEELRKRMAANRRALELQAEQARAAA